jgi:hypothetical protein
MRQGSRGRRSELTHSLPIHPLSHETGSKLGHEQSWQRGWAVDPRRTGPGSQRWAGDLFHSELGFGGPL